VREPKNKWMVGKAMLAKMPERTIVLVGDPSRKVTRYYLIEDVSEEAAAQGYKSGDIVLARVAHDIFLRAGTEHAVAIETHEVIYVERSMVLAEFTDLQGAPMVVPEAAQ